MIKRFRFFKNYVQATVTGSVLLVLAVCVSFIIANTSLNELFNHLLGFKLGADLGSIHLKYSVLGWINDGLMAVFFLLVGLEIKYEIINGELADTRSATLPVIAAIGGMLIPAVIYTVININTSTIKGWGIPMATDIAFVIAMVGLLKSRVPASLQIFIKGLAIVDDLGAILVIAIFYATDVNLYYLWLASGMFCLQMILNKFNVKYLIAYLIPGVFMWYFIHHTGVHATVAGVLTALNIPYRIPKNRSSPLKKLMHGLENPVNLLIVPLFALANSNINIRESLAAGNVFNPLSAGILFGLLLGKPVGITLFSWLAVKFKLSKLAPGVRWKQMWGIGQLAGIGFTMSVFMAILSFSSAALQSQAKFSILFASISAAVLGYIMLTGKKVSV